MPRPVGGCSPRLTPHGQTRFPHSAIGYPGRGPLFPFSLAFSSPKRVSSASIRCSMRWSPSFIFRNICSSWAAAPVFPRCQTAGSGTLCRPYRCGWRTPAKRSRAGNPITIMTTRSSAQPTPHMSTVAAAVSTVSIRHSVLIYIVGTALIQWARPIDGVPVRVRWSRCSRSAPPAGPCRDTAPA